MSIFDFFDSEKIVASNVLVYGIFQSALDQVALNKYVQNIF